MLEFTKDEVKDLFLGGVIVLAKSSALNDTPIEVNIVSMDLREPFVLVRPVERKFRNFTAKYCDLSLTDADDYMMTQRKLKRKKHKRRRLA